MTGGVDTNVLLGIILPGTARARTVEAKLESHPGTVWYCLPQAIYEAFVVLTRPANVNGHEMDPAEAEHLLNIAMARITVLPDPPDLHVRWLALYAEHDVSGKSAHDARIAAWTVAHDLLFTLDPRGFVRYPVRLA